MGEHLAAKAPSDSEVVLVQLMTILDANNVGNVHGGSIMKLVDTAAGLSAARHCGGLAVTAAMDEMSFLEPVYVNDLVTIKAMVNDAGSTSVEVGVRVEAENPASGRKALDADGKPRRVPPVEPRTEEERQRQVEAKLRRENRLARAAAIKAARDDGEVEETRADHQRG
jgi:acyl-CoA hydrolase